MAKYHESKNVKIRWVKNIKIKRVHKCQIKGRLQKKHNLDNFSCAMLKSIKVCRAMPENTPVTLGYVLKRLVLEKQQDCGHFLWCSTNAALLVLYCGGFLHMKIYSSMRAYIGANIIPK